MKGLTLWQPWGWGVITGAKPVENRPWPPPAATIGETIAIHGGLKYDVDGEDFLRAKGLRWTNAEAIDDLHHGGILGTVRVDGFAHIDQLFRDEILSHPMAFGPYCWKLSHARRLKVPIPCKGALGLWKIPAEVEAAMLAQFEKMDREAEAAKAGGAS